MANDVIIKNNQNTTRLLNFLKQSAKQYPCLSKKKEQELINKYKDNRDELNRLLFMHNIKIVFNQAKKYMSKVDNFDDLVQDGMYGLSEAIKRFDLSKNVKFITYCVPWVRKYMLMHFYGREVEIKKNSTSLDAALAVNSKTNDNEVAFENYINDYLDPTSIRPKTIHQELSSNEQIKLCKDLYDRVNSDTSLSSTEKAVFTEAFYYKEKTRDIAEKYDIEMKDVSNIKHKILEKLKLILEKEYNINSFEDISAMD